MLHVLVLGLILCNQQFVAVNLLHKTLPLSLHDLTILIILLLQTILDMLHPLKKHVLLVLEFIELKHCLPVIMLHLDKLFSKHHTGFANDHFLDF